MTQQNQSAAAAPMFRTADYGIAGYLFACGFELQQLGVEGSRVVFQFESSHALLDAVGNYTSNIPVPCRDYFQGLRRAKNMISDSIRSMQHENSSTRLS